VAVLHHLGSIAKRQESRSKGKSGGVTLLVEEGVWSCGLHYSRHGRCLV